MKEQLQEILCTVDSVNKDVKELRFGCKVKYYFDSFQWEEERLLRYLYEDNTSIIYENISNIKDWCSFSYNISEYLKSEIVTEDFKKLWNPLSLKHLMMYCKENQIICNLENSWYITFVDNRWKPKNWIVKYDITKDYLHEQEDKVLLDIINFLKGYNEKSN